MLDDSELVNVPVSTNVQGTEETVVHSVRARPIIEGSTRAQASTITKLVPNSSEEVFVLPGTIDADP